MKRGLAALVAVGAGVALLGGGVAVQAAKKTMSLDERAKVRLERQAKYGKRVNRPLPAGTRKPRGADNLIGTITYEPGPPPDAFASEPGGNNIVANRFNSAQGGPLRPGNLTQVTFFPGNVNGTVVLSFLGPPSGGVAPILAITYLVGIVGNQFNTVNVGPIAVGADFMAGQYVGAFGGTDQAALRNASVGGQGFHAHQMNFAGSVATGVVPLAGQNSIYRATGNLLVPVELMGFSTE